MIDVKAVFRSFLVKSDPKTGRDHVKTASSTHKKKELLQKKCKRDNLPNITFHLVDDHLYIVIENHSSIACISTTFVVQFQCRNVLFC